VDLVLLYKPCPTAAQNNALWCVVYASCVASILYKDVSMECSEGPASDPATHVTIISLFGRLQARPDDG
jgi:hypothetical protein